MNSGFLWGRGRRERVLPRWAHQRLAHGGAPFPRVISNGFREGFYGVPRTADPYFCFEWVVERTRRENLGASICAETSVAEKGRVMTVPDFTARYAEPYVDSAGEARWRRLAPRSPYPPRRDLVVASERDHPDVARFRPLADDAMPELDAVTIATPRADVAAEVEWRAPTGWPAGTYSVFVEAHQEGDYGGAWTEESLPTPTEPAGAWDYWALMYGYPFRGQPSVVYRVDVEIGRVGEARSALPVGRTGWFDADGALHPSDDLVDDPGHAPGSGADRLRAGVRGRNRLVASVVCE